MPRMTWRRHSPGQSPSSPVISGVADAEVSTTARDVSWAVSPSSSGEVRYGTTDGGPYPFVTTRQVAPLPFHLQRVAGLTSGTPYFYVVWARDPVTGLESLSSQGTFTIGSAPSSDYPPETPLVFLAKPAFTAPTFGQVKTDPQYGTEVTVVTAAAGPRVRYASKSVENADGSMGLLDGTSGQRVLFRTFDFSVINPNLTTDGGATWDPVQPDILWTYVNPNVIRKNRIDPGTGTKTVIASAPLTQYNQIVLGGNQGSLDNAGLFLAIKWTKSNGNAGVSVFSTASMSVTAEVTLASSGSISTTDACGIAQSGERVAVVNSAQGTGVAAGCWSYPIDLSTGTRRFLSTGGDHWDTGLLADGTTDVWVACNQSVTGGVEQGGTTGCIGMYDMVTGAYTPLKQNWPNGTISARNILRPGYCYPSSYSPTGTFPGFSTVYAIELADPPYAGGDVEVFGNYHGVNSTTYTDQTNACPSIDGARVYVNGNWDGAAGRAFAFAQVMFP